METLHHAIHQTDTKSPSPEMFSFPGTPDADNSDFEFGSCVTPSSPTTPSNDPSKNNNSTSPADQFFLNGRLLPHEFPTIVTSSSRPSFSTRENAMSSSSNNNVSSNLSRGTSVGSNMSMVSSRSNSTNSRGSTCSTCSSARTSASEVSERKTFHKRMHMRGYCRTASVRDQRNVSRPSTTMQYYGGSSSTSGSSQRWQFITSAPVLGHSLSRRSVGSTTSPRKIKERKKSSISSSSGSGSSSSTSGSLLHRILRSFVARCKACHAMEGQENEFDLNEGSVLGN